MSDRAEFVRYLTIFLLTAPSAAAIWLAFRGLYGNLSQTEAVVGYVDPGTQAGIDLGYVAMVFGVLAFGGIAVWAGTRLLSLWLRGRRSNGR